MRNKAVDIDSLVRPNIRRLQPYRSARKEFGSGVLLDANENSMGAPSDSLEGLHRYPSPRHPRLRERIARWRGVESDNVFLGVGSDEAIDLLLRIFCEPGRDRVLVAPPTYGMYEVSARIHDAAVDRVEMDTAFQPRPEAMREAWGPRTKLLFLCSPNNPTGNLLDPDKVDRIIENFPGIVVVDEAYIDFCETPSRAPQVRERGNLVVLQTFSKSFGMAGARVGIAFAGEAVIRYIMKVKAPYNLSSPAAARAAEALDHIERMRRNASAIRRERERLGGLLEKLPHVQAVFPSHANFLLARFGDARRIWKELAEAGIIVRYRGDEPLCERCLRITVGRPEETDQLIETLKKLNP